METNQNAKKKRNLMIILITLATTVIFLLGGATYMGIKLAEHKQEEQRKLEQDHALYKRGFRLLEEQIATYIKEHYEGVSKIEFSPIFEDGRDGSSMFNLEVVPIITDNYGHKASLGTQIGKRIYSSFQLGDEIDLDFSVLDDSEMITLINLDTGEEFDVSKEDHLPEKAKLSSNAKSDRNILALVQDGQLEGVFKSDKGSPEAKITYNLEIKEGVRDNGPNR